jgi:hypothetical protein
MLHALPSVLLMGCSSDRLEWEKNMEHLSTRYYYIGVDNLAAREKARPVSMETTLWFGHYVQATKADRI